MWPIILLIVGIALIKIGIEGNKEESESKKIEPPTEDVYILGCCGSVECDYWGLEYYIDSSGRMEIRQGVCRCSYQGKIVKEFSQCPYAKEHPEQLRKSSWWQENEAK